MDNPQNEHDFSRIVREHKSTIYTVCYMFSKDEDEVNDLLSRGADKPLEGIRKLPRR